MIKIARMKKGLSQRQLAKILKVKQSYVSRLERGKIDCVTTNLIIDLAKAIDLDPTDVFLYIISSKML